MTSMDRLTKLAERFARKIALAQGIYTPQAGELQTMLQDMKVLPTSEQVGPLLNVAKVPETASVQINVVVDKTLNAKFVVTTTPPDKSAAVLQTLLDRKYSTNIKLALVSKKVQVTDTMTFEACHF